MNDLIQPTVNLNGSDQQDLVRQGMAIVAALDAAIRAYRTAMPHGRDYPAPMNEHFSRWGMVARASWQERIELLAEMHREMNRWTMAVDDQGGRGAYTNRGNG